jgi:hypothetical protein
MIFTSYGYRGYQGKKRKKKPRRVSNRENQSKKIIEKSRCGPYMLQDINHPREN